MLLLAKSKSADDVKLKSDKTVRGQGLKVDASKKNLKIHGANVVKNDIFIDNSAMPRSTVFFCQSKKPGKPNFLSARSMLGLFQSRISLHERRWSTPISEI